MAFRGSNIAGVTLPSTFTPSFQPTKQMLSTIPAVFSPTTFPLPESERWMARGEFPINPPLTPPYYPNTAPASEGAITISQKSWLEKYWYVLLIAAGVVFLGMKGKKKISKRRKSRKSQDKVIILENKEGIHGKM